MLAASKTAEPFNHHLSGNVPPSSASEIPTLAPLAPRMAVIAAARGALSRAAGAGGAAVTTMSAVVDADDEAVIATVAGRELEAPASIATAPAAIASRATQRNRDGRRR